MKNITTIKKTALASKLAFASKIAFASKTAMKKITAKITTTALLFFLALFTLTTNLKAQAVQDNSKSGFFAGFVYLQGFQVDTTKNISESTVTTSYEVTGISDTTRIEVSEFNPDLNLDATEETGIKTLLSANCERDATSIDNIDGQYSFGESYFISFDPGEKPILADVTTTGDGIGTVNGNFPTGTETGETPYCHTYFYGDLSAERTLFTDYKVTADSPPVEPQVSAESDKLSGIGLQFGYRWEKWRASFTHYTGQGGDNELTNSLAIADYFFQEKFFVGAGLASIKLTNSSAEGDSISASATSPVLQVGYTENLTSNLKLSIGVLQYSSGLSLSSTTLTPTTPTITYLTEKQTATNVGDSATIGSIVTQPGGGYRNLQVYRDPNTPENSFDYRLEVTQVGTRTVNIEEIVTPAGGGTIEAELKAPTVISISFHLSF